MEITLLAMAIILAVAEMRSQNGSPTGFILITVTIVAMLAGEWV